VDTGIFEGNMELAEASATAGNSKLEVASGDRLTVFYDDPKGDWGTALQVRDEALYAATVIKGSTYMQDVVWTKDDSPYLVTGDVTISSGRSLTIKEGVKVIFLANSDDTVGGEEKYDSELLVEGSISVLGTEAEPVVFTSSETAPLHQQLRVVLLLSSHCVVAVGQEDHFHSLLDR
jgi:hypothetical protein